LTEKGRQLETLIQRHVLFAALKYRSIAVEELTDDGNRCEFEQLSARISGQLRPGQAAIFLRGRLFEQENAIRLQTTVEFWAPGRADTIRWTTGGSAGPVMATLPSEPIMFAPRVIPFSLLQQMESAQQRARRLHAAPDENSSYTEIPSGPDARIGFEVVGTRDDWMQIRLWPAGGEGWVPAHALATAGELKGVFPELYFIDGLIGYYELWAGAPAQDTPASERTLEAALASLRQYADLTDGLPESEARAVAAILEGNAILRAHGGTAWTTEQLQRAQRSYGEARKRAPSLTLANNFYLACSTALCARGACGAGTAQLHAQLLDAVAQDPTSSELVNNLGTFYGAAQSGRLSLDLSPAELSRQRQRIQSAMAKPP
jgi:hypothetical protein